MRSYVTFVPRSVRRAPRAAISSIYRQRLHGSFAELPSCRGRIRISPSISRMRPDTRASTGISGANITLRYMDILVVDFEPGSFCRRWCTAFRASSIRICRRHLIEKPRTINEPFTAGVHSCAIFACLYIVETSPEVPSVRKADQIIRMENIEL